MTGYLSPSAPRARLAVRLVPAALALLMCTSFGKALAQPVLTLAHALQLAQQRSQVLVAQDASATASRLMAQGAGQLPDPVIRGGITNLPVSGPDRFSLTRDFMTMRSIGVMQEFTGADKRLARSTRFEREADLAQAGAALALVQLRQEAASAWLERHFQERARALLLEQRAETSLQVQAADAAYRGGRGAQADLFNARFAVAQIDDRIRQAELQIAVATTRLQRWVGPAGAQPLGGLPDLELLRLNASALETALQGHPQIMLLQRQEDLARADAAVAQANKRADWSVELMFSQRGPRYSNMASINFAIPWQLDQKNRQDRELAAKLALVEQAGAQREERVRELLAETLNWLQQWNNLRDRRAHADASLIPLAAERSRATLASYRGGNTPLAGVLAARSAEIDLRIERLRLEMEGATVWARLQYLLPPPALEGATQDTRIPRTSP